MKNNILEYIFPTKNKKKIEFAKQLFWMIIGFLYIFFPPITKLNTLYYLSILSYIYIFFNINSFIKFISRKYIFGIIFFWLIMFFYLILIAKLNSMPLIGIARDYLYLILLCIPICFWICDNIKYFNFDCIIKVMLIIGNLQGCLALISLFSDSFHNWVLKRLLYYGFDSERYSLLAKYRLYGYAFHMTNYMPMVLAMLLIIAVEKSRKEPKFFIYIPLLFIGIILNSRSSLVLVGVGLFILLIMSIKKPSVFIKYAFLLIIISIISLFLIKYFILNSDSWYSRWIKTGVESVLNLFKGKKTNYFEYIYESDIWSLPKGINFFCGYGSNDHILIDAVSSDIGFVNYFRLGGLFYCVFVLLSVLWIMHPLRKVNNFYYIFFIASFFVMNIKDTLFTANEYICFILLFCILSNKYIESNKNNCLFYIAK